MTEPLTFGSLFAGIGGFDLGFQRAGMAGRWTAEIDPKCSELLRRRFPDIPNVGDVKNATKETVEPVKLICGGFPCQDLSTAGKRAGLAGKRSGLWFEFYRVLSELRPNWTVVENVPGLLSSNGGRDFAEILFGLGKLGYRSAWRILDAQYFGIPQRRRRLFIVASFGNGRSAKVLFESEGLSRDSKARRETGARTAAALAENYRGNGRPAIGEPFTYDARGNGKGDLVNNLTGDHNDRITDYTALVWDAPAEVFAFDWRQGDEKGSRIGKGRASIVRKGDYTGSLSAIRQDAVTTRTGARRLTPIECERLQGFPDGWTAGFSDRVRYRMTGNAVAVPVIEWIGRRIIAAENENG